MNVEEYKGLKDQFEKLDKEKTTLQGELKALESRKAEIVKRLKEEFNLTPEQLDEKVKELETKIDQEVSKIKKKLGVFA